MEKNARLLSKIGDYTCVISIVTFGVKDVWKEAVAITNYNIDKAEVCTGYTLFRNYVFGGTMRLKSKLYISRKCYKFIKRLCREKKVEEYLVNGKYIGLCVFDIE